MSTFNYGRMRDTADRLISRFGRDAVISRSSASGAEYDPVLTQTNYPVKAAIIDYTNSEVNGTSVLAGDKRALVKAGGLTIEILTSDKFYLGATPHTIVKANQVNPGGTAVLYDLQLRR